MTAQTIFIEPLDVLFLRGNTLFGHAGSYGESAMPPKPSVFSGALRSALLVAKGHDLAAFARGEINDPELGTPEAPGSIVVTGFGLARRAEQSGEVEPLFAAPSDVILRKSTSDQHVPMLRPTTLHSALLSSQATSAAAVVAQERREKVDSGKWLSAAGWTRYLAGEPIQANQLVSSACLWKVETRIGIGLDAAKRRAADGQLFSSQAIAPRKSEGFDVGFLATVSGVEVPHSLVLRFGGDGRAAMAYRVSVQSPQPDYHAMVGAQRFRMVLTTPGLFENGWRPTGVNASGAFSLHGVRGRLSCAAVARAEVISGFDLAKGCPKPAERVAPTGSVYWLEDVEATVESLHKLVEAGLWSENVENRVRKAEGFNRIALAAY